MDIMARVVALMVLVSPISGYLVTLAGTGGSNFRGFLCQARAAIDSDTTVGTLADDDATVTFANNCGAGSITHSENRDKGSAKFRRTPSSETSNVHIVCTVVQTNPIYWVKAVHAQVSPCSSAARATLAFMASVGVLLAYVI